MIKGLLSIITGRNETKPEIVEREAPPYEFIFNNGLDTSSQADFVRLYACSTNDMDPVSFMNLVRKY